MNSKPSLTPYARYRRNLKAASSNLLLFAVLSAVNVVLLLSGSGLTFTFSAYLPDMLVGLGQYAQETTGDGSILVVFIALSILFVAACVASALLAKKRSLWLILGLALVVIDSALMVLDIVPVIALWVEAGMTASLVIYFLFHAWILYYLVNGLIAYGKLKRLPPEPVVYDVPAGVPAEAVAETVDTSTEAAVQADEAPLSDESKVE